MAQMNDHMLILGDKDMPFTPYVESSINVNGIYELPTNSYVDYDNKKIVNADGSEISVETTGELNIYGQATYIYQDNHLLSSKYLGIIEYGIPLA